jgi:hypothetical protein
MRRLLKLSAFHSVLVIAGCCAPAQRGEQHEYSFAEIVNTAKNAVREQRPEWSDALDLPPRVTEIDDTFRVSFKLPADTIGGTPVIVLRKKDLAVVSVHHSQ